MGDDCRGAVEIVQEFGASAPQRPEALATGGGGVEIEDGTRMAERRRGGDDLSPGQAGPEAYGYLGEPIILDDARSIGKRERGGRQRASSRARAEPMRGGPDTGPGESPPHRHRLRLAERGQRRIQFALHSTGPIPFGLAMAQHDDFRKRHR